MAIVVVNQSQSVVVVSGREYAPESVRTGKAEGVFEVEVASGDGRGTDGTGNCTEGGVVVVCRDAIARFKVNEFRDVLVPVKGVDEFVVTWVGKHKERACRY